MRIFSNLSLSLLAASSLALTGCQQFTKPQLDKTQITGRPGEVSLNSAKTGLIQAETPEELLKTATGWQAPITHLVNWVQAKPATVQAQIQRDNAKRAVQIIEDGWSVELSYNEQAHMPNRLILKQALENGAENRITMVIQNR